MLLKNKDLELFCKYYIENLKYELLIPNFFFFFHMLFCKRFIRPDIDRKICFQTYVSIEAINRSFAYNFKNIYIKNGFSTDILGMFSKDSFVSYKIDVIFHNSRCLELVSLSDNCCMIFQSCDNPSAVFVVFSEILLRVLSNNLYDFVECFKRYKVGGGYSKLYD